MPTLDSDLLTRRDLGAGVGGSQNAYSAVERLWPLFLATRPGSGSLQRHAGKVQVFINGMFSGDVDVLRTIPLGSVESIRRVRTSAACKGEFHAGDSVLLVRLR